MDGVFFLSLLYVCVRAHTAEVLQVRTKSEDADGVEQSRGPALVQ